MAYPTYYIYTRLNAHVSWDDDKIRHEVRLWARKALKNGEKGLTTDLIEGVVAEHHDAQALFRDMRF